MLSEADYAETAWHWTRAEEFWRNADAAAAKGEWNKASELLWESASQAAKMAGILWGQRWDDHAGTFRIVRFLAQQINDRTMVQSLSTLQLLHSNFYDDLMDAPAVREAAVTVWSLNWRVWTLTVRRLAGM